MPYKSAAAQAENNRRWREANRDKTRTSCRAKVLRREHGGDLTTADVRYVLDQPCAYCGGMSEQVEHVTPICRGGRNDADNVVGACAECNYSKRYSTPLEFFGMWPGHELDAPF